jgi:hypothetical protein
MMQSVETIKLYASSEGTPWIAWVSDPLLSYVNIAELERKRTVIPKCKSILYAGIDVHAFKFASGEEWDTINGDRKVNMKLVENMQKSHVLTNNFKARPGITYETNCACGSLYVTVNRWYDMETLQGIKAMPTCELFIRIGKAGGCASALNESVGKLASAYLQKGGSLEEVVKLLGGVSCHSANSETLSCIGAMAEILKEHLNKEV